MKIGETILGYKLVTNATVSSGRCTWAFAEKSGKKYFVKEFLSPKYPIEGAPGSRAQKNGALKRCEVFELLQRRILGSIGRKVASGGSLVAPVDFGRAGTTYYKVYDRIDVANLSSPQISILTSEAKLLIMRVAAHSLSILHRERIVHGDLKPANILIKKSETGAYTSKLIDFDDSYFDGEPPDDAELVIGDPAYYSPELLRYVITNDNTLRGKISTKSDIFALGLIFAEYWTGKMPTYKTSRFGSCAAAVWGGEDLQFDASTMRKEVSTLIRSMIQLDPNNRPSAPEVLSHLKLATASTPESKPGIATWTGASSRLLGSGLVRSSHGSFGEIVDSESATRSPASTPASVESRLRWKNKK